MNLKVSPLHIYVSIKRKGPRVDVSFTCWLFFTILNVDLWIHGRYTDSKRHIDLIDTMYDMVQVVLGTPDPDKIYVTLASHFIQHVLMKFDIASYCVG